MNCSVPSYEEQFEDLTHIRPILQLSDQFFPANQLTGFYISVILDLYGLKQSVAQTRHTALSSKKKQYGAKRFPVMRRESVGF